jgi:DNA polymerase I-like protein with 3'-5' exonuclease and polymerase domains
MSEDDIDEVAHPEWTDDEEEEDWEEREQKVALKEEIVEAVDKLVSAVTELKKPRKTRVKKENISDDDVKVTVPAASKKPAAKKKPKDLRTVFRALLKTLDIEKLKRPWMASKVLRRVDSAQELEGWVEKILHDTSLHHPTPSGQVLPVVACDTETITLDTRVMIDLVQARDTSGNEVWVPIYEVKMEIAGICLSADGIEGIYVPINHADGHNVSREDCHRILQHLFNNCHLVFYHAKFDREVIRQTLGIDMRPYPFFEDVQVFNYLNDPKADLGDQKKGQYTGDTGGLKNLSLIKLGIDQIELDQIGKVSADFFNPETGKTTTRIQYVPFTWIPTDIAYWYAASDAICTWLLWWQLKDEARKLKLVHRIDHELVDSLTWIERQRYIVDTDRHKRTVKWHQAKLEVDRARLRGIAIEAGYKEEDGEQFNPDSNKQMAKLLFQTMKLRVLRRSKKTQDPSCDAETISDLAKIYPDNIFLKTYGKYKAYVALHPENLHFDPKDHTARIYLRSCVVAGGRLSATGGKYEVDGGFGLNIQGIKRVEGNWWVKGNVLEPDNVDPESVEEHAPEDLHPSCWKTEERTIKTKIGEEPVLDWDTKPMVDKDGRAIVKEIFDSKKEEYKVKAPNIIKNHIGQYLGYAICLVPGCKTCAKNYGILIENGRMDANEVINLRAMFKAPTGWTFATIDYSNVEMRVAANISGEPEFIKEFLEGSGDFHSLTASKVFPEFNDPNIDKATKKSYRALAKILNFALLYGGTAYTIFENMKKKDPNITFEHAQEMVDAYWAGVPVFREYCDRKQAIAKEKMTCQTATGRIIKFDSAMSALGIHNPTKHEMDNYWEYRRLDKAATLAEKSKDKETFRELRDRADIMWKTPETGVRNVGDYNQFMGKIQRVAVNVPMQGLAGDFMRITLNRIRKWAAEKDPMVQAVLLMHGSVHDEIDFSFKNEYAPFILPRLTRLMKLRKYHASMNWRVPLECDTEYGRSWDVEHHLTGDDGHKPAGWSEIPGMENYVPEEFDIDTVRALLTALKSGDEKRREKVKGWLKENLHTRAFEEASKHIFAAKDGKEMRKYLIIGLQLHEFWKTDEIPEDQDDKLETLEQFEARCGLTPADRGLMPVFGYIGAIPLDINVKRPELPILGEDEQLEIQFTTDIPKPITLEDREQIAEQAREIVERKQVVSIVEELNKKLDTKLDDEDNLRSEIGKLHKQIAEAEGTQIDENELLLDIPVRKVVVKPPEAKPEPKPNLKLPAKADIPELRNLTAADAKALRESLGIGTNKVKAMYQGQVVTFTDVNAIRVPDSFIRE